MSEPITLSSGKLVTRQMKGGETHSYRIMAQKGEFLHVVVGQLGIDVQVSVTHSNSTPIHMDSPNGDYGPEYLMFIAQEAGPYFIDIQALDPQAPSGTYVISIDEQHSAGVQDNDRVTAQRAFIEGTNALELLKPADRLQAGAKYEAAAAAYERAHDVYGEGASFYALAIFYSMIGNRDKALDCYRRAAALFETLRDSTASLNLLLGRIYITIGQLDQDRTSYVNAKAAFQRATRNIRKMHGVNPAQVADLLMFSGETDFYLKNLHDAEGELRNALRIRDPKSDNDPLTLARISNDLGRVYECKGPTTFQKSDDYLNRALTLRQNAPGDSNEELVLSSVTALAVIYTKEQKFASAEQLLRDRLSKLQPAPPNNEGRPSALTKASLANVYIEEGKYVGAEELLQSASAICEHDCPELPVIRELLGRLYMDEGRLAEADEILRGILNAYPVKEKSENHARALHNVALLYKTEKKYQDAEQYLEQSLDMSRNLAGFCGEQAVSNAEELGVIKLNLQQYTQAEPLLKKAIGGLSAFLGNSSRLAAAFNNLATLYRDRNDYRRAAATYNRALKMLHRTAPQNPYVARVLSNLGELQRATGNYRQAESTLKSAISVEEAVPGKVHYDLSAPLWNLAAVYQSEQRFEEAKPLLDRGLQNLQEEFDQHFRYMTEKERLQFLNSVSDLFNFYLSFCVAHCDKDPELRRSTYDLLLWEKGVVATSVAGLRNKVIGSDNTAAIALLAQLNKENSELSSMDYLRLRGIPIDQEKIQGVGQQAREDERKLVKEISGLAEEKQLTHASWIDVQHSLNERQAAVEIAQFTLFSENRWTKTDYYIALIVTPDIVAPNIVLLGPGATLDATLGEYCAQIFKSEDLHRCAVFNVGNTLAGDSLYGLLWKPLLSSIGAAHRIYLSPAGVLNEIAIGIIPTPGNTRLLDEYDIRIVNSSKDLLRSKKQVNNSAVLIGNPKFLLSDDEHQKAVQQVSKSRPVGIELMGHPKLSAWTPRGFNLQQHCENKPADGGYLCPLPATDNEVQSIYHLLGRAEWTVDPPYTEQYALEEVIKGVHHPRLLHVATHGFFHSLVNSNAESIPSNDQAAIIDPMILSGLYLAGADRVLNGHAPLQNVDDGVLTAFEASGLDLFGTELVVLSACDTGLGQTRASEGIFGLRRALQESGAESVLLTMWSVPDTDTQKLLTAFYQKWLPGMDKHDALKQAQLELRNDVRSRFGGEDRPFYWGAFVLVGP
jgi:tetratricopeptide (TPR) repeat protein